LASFDILFTDVALWEPYYLFLDVLILKKRDLDTPLELIFAATP
jgi:hypothetical protein